MTRVLCHGSGTTTLSTQYDTDDVRPASGADGLAATNLQLSQNVQKKGAYP